ncbi:MAG: leucyl aminopeptidase, partial [Xanthomonas perforans]|nr:leucyl aminopeptidase [Xanthomonas perforans]
AWNIRQAIIVSDHAAYRYTATLGKKKVDETGLTTLAIAGDDARALAVGVATAEGVEFARELGNLPPNYCTPAYLAETAAGFAGKFPGAEAEILDETQMESLGMGS